MTKPQGLVTEVSMDADSHSGHAPGGPRRARASCFRRKRPFSKLVFLGLITVFVGAFYIHRNQADILSAETSWRPKIPHVFGGSTHDSNVDTFNGKTQNPLYPPSDQHDGHSSSSSTSGSYQSFSTDEGASSSTNHASDTDPPTTQYGPNKPYNSCQSVSASVITDLQRQSTPTLKVFSNNREVSSTESLAVPAPVCVLVAMPQVVLPKENYTDAPTKGRGPDTIHFYLNSTDVIVTFPPLPLAPHQPHASDLYPTEGVSIIYAADTVLFTAGKYEIVAEHEFAHWYWAQEWEVTGAVLVGEAFLPTLTTTTGVSGNFSYDLHRQTKIPLPSGTINVEGPKSIPSRPPCSDVLNAGVGRWYKQETFPELSKEMTDEWGYTWQGDYCHLDHYTPEETMECLEDKTIQFFGDSMARRTLKSIISGGAWCYNLTHLCQDADDGEDLPVEKLDFDPETQTLVRHEFERGRHFQHPDASPIHFGRNSTVYFSFVTQVANWPGHWMDRLFDPEDLIRLKEPFGEPNDNFTDRAIKDGALSHARPPPESGEVDLLILGTGAWDQGFTNRFDDYERELWQFKESFIMAYSRDGREIPMVMRMANSWCCRPTENAFKRYTGSRIVEFDARTKKVFDYKDGGIAADGRIMVVDPINMNGRSDVLSDYRPSGANHPRASHVRLEMQMLMNSVCKKDSQTGKTIFRRSA